MVKIDYRIIKENGISAWREIEAELIVTDVMPHGEKFLEFGCGGGELSFLLSKRFRYGVCSDINLENLRSDVQVCENLDFQVASAHSLSKSFSCRFDLILSSNVLEHCNVPLVLDECKMLLQKDGMMIHTMPNSIWKVANFLLFYPALIRKTAARLFGRLRYQDQLGSDLDANLKSRKARFFFSALVPAVHGVSCSHYDEFFQFSKRAWIKVFEDNGFMVQKVISLPFYHGHGYIFTPLIKLCNFLSVPASYAYVVRFKDLE